MNGGQPNALSLPQAELWFTTLDRRFPLMTSDRSGAVARVVRRNVPRVIASPWCAGERDELRAQSSDLFRTGSTLLRSWRDLDTGLQFLREAGATERVRLHQEVSRDVPHEVCW